MLGKFARRVREVTNQYCERVRWDQFYEFIGAQYGQFACSDFALCDEARLDAEILAGTDTSDIARIIVRRHACTFFCCASSPDSNVHMAESKEFSMATLRLLVGFSRGVLH